MTMLLQARAVGVSRGANELFSDLEFTANSGDRVGVVTGVVLADAQDRLVITTSTGSEVEIPFVDELVSEVHPSGGFVVVMPPEGLLDD